MTSIPTRMRRLKAFLAVALLAACSDPAGPSLALPSGQLHVEYDAGTARTLEATGSLRLSEGRVGADGCSATLFFDGVTANDPHREVDPDVDRACILTQGTVTVTTQTVTRIAGTFAGVGYCVFDRRYDSPTPFTVYAGRFDVPIDLRYVPRIDLYQEQMRAAREMRDARCEMRDARCEKDQSAARFGAATP